MTDETAYEQVAYPCHFCDMKLDLTTEYYGMKIQCPGCGEKFIVQDPAASAQAAQEAAAQQAAAQQAAQEAAAREAAAQQAAAAQEAAAQQAAQAAVAQEAATQQQAATKAAARRDEALKSAAAKEKEAALRKAAREAAGHLEPVIDEMRTDVMMRDFKGKKVLFLVLAALIFHAVIIVGSSFGYLASEVFGEDTSEMTKEDRVDVALGEATSALSEIAERHTLTMNDILEKFAAVDSGDSSSSDTSNPSTDTDVQPVDVVDPVDPVDPVAPVDPVIPVDPVAPVDPVLSDKQKAINEFQNNLIKPQQGPSISISDEDDDTGL